MPIDRDRLLSFARPSTIVPYTDRDVLLYAVAVGAGPEDLRFVYERDLTVIPSFANSLAFDDGWLGETGIDLAQVVHGSLDLRFLRPLAPAGEVTVGMRVAGLSDKGAGRAGLVIQEIRLEQGGQEACTIQSVLFVRGGGGFGGSAGTQPEQVPTPPGQPQRRVEVATAPNQALLFRLLGDRNPLHVDPAQARASGFERPILHGACTFGIACLTLLRHLCDTDPARLTRLAARFAGPLYPGGTLDFEFWDSPGGATFRATGRERAALVLDNGFAGVA